MRILIISFVLLFTNSYANAQEWQTDLTTAKELAIANNHKIKLVFEGSDWCAPCMKLEKEIWKSSYFKDYSKENFVLLKADFPKRKANKLSDEQQEKNDVLAEKYNTQGYFPLVVVLDGNGKVLGKTGYKKMSPEEYVDMLAKF